MSSGGLVHRGLVDSSLATSPPCFRGTSLTLGHRPPPCSTPVGRSVLAAPAGAIHVLPPLPPPLCLAVALAVATCSFSHAAVAAPLELDHLLSGCGVHMMKVPPAQGAKVHKLSDVMGTDRTHGQARGVGGTLTSVHVYSCSGVVMWVSRW